MRVSDCGLSALLLRLERLLVGVLGLVDGFVRGFRGLTLRVVSFVGSGGKVG